MKINLTHILFSLFFFLSIQSHSKVIYVNSNIIDGNNNGTSWQDSYSDFQDAISEAVYGDSIWVAEGIYFPTSGNNRTISFELKNGVKWFGGFQGNEIELFERDFNLYSTVLSGDINVLNDSTDNSYHVIYSIDSDTTTILDGFLIVDGNAVDTISNNTSPNNYGGGLFIDPTTNNPIAKLKILNCTFEKNNAKCGGAISFGKGYTTYNINPYIKGCSFINNKTVLPWGNGGALSLIGGSDNEETIFIRDCLFENNQSSYQGGAVYLSETASDFDFNNCNFIGNGTYGNDSQGNPNGIGGAVSYFVSFFDNLSRLDFLDCSFINNNSRSGGAISIDALVIFTEDNLELKLKNTSFVNNNSDAPSITGSGGSVINFNSFVKNQNFIIENSDFIDNESVNGKPIIRWESSAVIGTAADSCCFKISDCKFINNGARCFLFSEVGFNSVHYFISISNNIFKGNKNVIGFSRSNISSFESQVSNCTFLKNDGLIIGGNIDENNMIDISNSIFWEDLPIDEIFIGDAQGFNIHHSLLKSPDCLINGINYCGDGMLYNLYPAFRDTMNNDFSLRSCSPAINQGDDLSIDTLGIFFDIEGNPRILDDAVDLGAYETQAFEVLVPQAQHVNCHGGADGGITWVQHGTPPFTFEWDDGVTMGSEFTELSTGNYSIAVMDADNCLDTFNMTVNQPLPLEITDTVTAATGAMNADGMIEVIPSGGFSDYQYLWSNGDTTAMIENLLPGEYTVTVTDANGCEAILMAEVGFMTAVNNLDKKYALRLIPNLMEQGTTAHLVIEVEKNTSLGIEIYNEIGQLFFSEKIEIEQGENKYELPMMEQRGLFFVKIKTDDGRGEVLKFVVQ